MVGELGNMVCTGASWIAELRAGCAALLNRELTLPVGNDRDSADCSDQSVVNVHVSAAKLSWCVNFSARSSMLSCETIISMPAYWHNMFSSA